MDGYRLYCVLINATSKYNGYPSGFLTQTIATDAGDVCPILELVGNRDASAGNQNAMIQFFNKTSTAVEVGRITSAQGSAVNSGDLLFHTSNAGTLDERMRIDSSGKILLNNSTYNFIGTNTSDGSNTQRIYIGAGNDATATQGGLISVYGNEQASTSEQGQVSLIAGRKSTGNIRFWTGEATTTERMRIESSGRIKVSGTNYSTASGGVDTGGLILVGDVHGDNNYTAGIGFSMATGTAGISGVQNGTDADRIGLSFFTHGSGAGSAASAEAMRITSGGDVLISKQSLNLGLVGTEFRANGQSLFTAAGDNSIDLNRLTNEGEIALFRQAGTVVGNISVTSSATTYNTLSDYRLKEDLQDFAGLDMVSKIPVYDFKWKTDESRSYGVMAHELQEVLPDAVSGEKDAEEMQSVDYSKIVPLLVKSIQELKAEVDLLKQECKCKN